MPEGAITGTTACNKPSKLGWIFYLLQRYSFNSHALAPDFPWSLVNRRDGEKSRQLEAQCLFLCSWCPCGMVPSRLTLAVQQHVLGFSLYSWVPLVKRWMIQEWENSTLRSAAHSWTNSDARQDSTHHYSFIPVQVQSACVACLEHKGALKFLPLVAGGFSRWRSISGSVSEHLSVLPGFPLSFLIAWGTPRTSVQLLSVAAEFVRIYFCSCVRWHSCWWN